MATQVEQVRRQAKGKKTPPIKKPSISMMSIAVWISLYVHAVLLSIHFIPELKRQADKAQLLQVVLVNAKTDEEPQKSDLLAQTNLDRGGNTNLNRTMKTTTPVIKTQETEVNIKPKTETKSAKKTIEESTQETKEQQKRVSDLEKTVQALMTQIEADKKIDAQAAQKNTEKQTEKGAKENPNKELELQDLSAAAMEMDRLEAIIAKQQDAYQLRPKRKYIGAHAREYRYALYVESWRQKVEKIGNLNYPEAAKNLKLYGQLQMTVSIRSDGSIETIELDRSSGHKVLDDAARRIVEMGAPYARFPENIRKDVDILSITRTWTFTKEDGLSSLE